MKKVQGITAVIGMFLLIIAILITSFQAAIYGDPEYKFYEKEYEKYQVTESLQMEMEDVMDVTEKMMDYLIGKRPELSVETTVNGEKQDFFNEQDRLHMADVKNLFLGGLALRWWLLGIFALLMLVLIFPLKADWKRVCQSLILFPLGFSGSYSFPGSFICLGFYKIFYHFPRNIFY